MSVKSLILDTFRGHAPDLANPPPNSARAGKNYVLTRHRDVTKGMLGWIELAPGYAKKFDALPANDATIRKISAIAHENIYDLYIPNGSLTVTVVVATYTKTGFFPGNPTVNRCGVWIRPYYNGSSWVDEWRELTEMFIFTIKRLGVSFNDRLYIDDGTYNFKTLDPTGIVFGEDYFKNWTIVYADFGDAENYDLIADSGYVGEWLDDYSLKLVPGHLNTDFSTRTVGTKLVVYRSFLPKELPSSIASHIYGLLSEARISTGNNDADVCLMAGYRNNSFVQGGGNPYTRTTNAVIGGPGVLDIWQYAGVVGIDPTPVPDAGGLEAITWHFKYSLVMDDGSETKLFVAVTEAGGSPPDWTAGGGITLTELSKIKLYIYRSHGAMPVRARYLRLYMCSEREWPYYSRVADYDLRDASIWDNSAIRGAAIFGGMHFYARTDSGVYITGADWTNAGAKAETQIGRAVTDTGVIQFKHATVVGRRAYAVGVNAGGTLFPNHVFATTSSGDGAPQYDVFPQLSTLNIDLEYNDGDECRAVWPYGDRLFVAKRSSIIIVSYDSTSGAFVRDVVTKTDGICSVKTLADFEDVVYWAGYNGIYRYSTRGWQLLNLDWLLEWKAVTTANKEAAIGVFDKANRQYRIAFTHPTLGTIERVFDVDSSEWFAADLTNQPSRFASDTREMKVDFLSGSLIQTFGTGTRHDGTNFSLEYEFNDMVITKQKGVDILFQGVMIEYVSSVPLTVQLYKDGATLGSAATLAASSTRGFVKAPLSARGTRFYLKITATTTADSQSVAIKTVQAIYEEIPGGVSVEV
jgi:hypothetical protein